MARSQAPAVNAIAVLVQFCDLLDFCVKMIDLDQFTVELCCPRCEFFFRASIKEIRLEGVTICRGCKGNIQLADYLGEIGNARRVFQSALSELAETLSKPIKIKF
jgi:hypothetical protein